MRVAPRRMGPTEKHGATGVEVRFDVGSRVIVADGERRCAPFVWQPDESPKLYKARVIVALREQGWPVVK